jgi:ABC-type glycerol-3-phosphate transport system permease component
VRRIVRLSAPSRVSTRRGDRGRDEWGKIAAGGVSVMLPVLVFTMLVRRYLISGLMAGGVKE